MELLGVKNLTGLGAVFDVAVALAILAVGIGAPRRLRALAAGSAVAALCAAGFATIQLDFLRMGSGVFRYGSFADPSKEKVLFYRDGKTASIAVIEHGGSKRSIRTNGKTDAALSMRQGSVPGPDEETMLLAAALPLALRPDATLVANIGFGSGLTTHALLGSPRVREVDSIEIERMMVEGARLFEHRNRRAYEDPRSRIHIDDAKTFFAGRGPPLRRHRLRALQPVGERRLDALLRGVLRRGPQPPQGRRPARAVDPVLRHQRGPARLRLQGARQPVRRLCDLPRGHVGPPRGGREGTGIAAPVRAGLRAARHGGRPRHPGLSRAGRPRGAAHRGAPHHRAALRAQPLSRQFGLLPHPRPAGAAGAVQGRERGRAARDARWPRADPRAPGRRFEDAAGAPAPPGCGLAHAPGAGGRGRGGRRDLHGRPGR